MVTDFKSVIYVLFFGYRNADRVTSRSCRCPVGGGDVPPQHGGPGHVLGVIFNRHSGWSS